VFRLNSSKLRKVEYQDWGLTDYRQAWDRQSDLQSKLIKIKRGLADDVSNPVAGYLVFCCHPPVYTLGKSGKMDHVRLSEAELKEHGISFYKINRGGDITYHGPGQIVGYPVFDLDLFFTDLHKYVRFLEEAVVRTLNDFGIKAGRIKDYTGVWLDSETDHKRKICAIGVHMSRWVTMHGFAFNVNTDLSYFNHIIPCGIEESDKSVTSMEKELGYRVDEEMVREKLKIHFKQLFEFDYNNEI
jgi:lipoyl(octanoyl) transferase